MSTPQEISLRSSTDTRRSAALFLAFFLFYIWLLNGDWLAAILRPSPPPPDRLAPMRVRFLPTEEPEEPEEPPQATPPIDAQQIVDLPDQPPSPPTADARFLARQDQFAERDTVNPNVGPPKNTPNALAPSPQQTPTPPQPEEAQPENPLEEQVGELANKEAPQKPDVGREAEAPKRPTAPPRIEAPQASFEKLLAIAQGESSSQDNKLDDVETGDITLLNAKSSPFAAFVIERTRTILRYMTINFPLTSWRYNDVEGFGNPLEVEAVVDANGEVLSLSVVQRSGSTKLDRLVSSGVRSGLLGHAPPKEALEADGQLHFVFILHDGWVQAGLR